MSVQALSDFTRRERSALLAQTQPIINLPADKPKPRLVAPHQEAPAWREFESTRELSERSTVIDRSKKKGSNSAEVVVIFTAAICDVPQCGKSIVAAIPRVATQDTAELVLHERAHTVTLVPRGDHMKFWILACGALVAVAARAAYTFRHRHERKRRAQFSDQVSNEWLATAKIHEDHN